MTKTVKKKTMVPPDGGWGWLIVFGVALTNSFNQSLLAIYGLIFGDKLIEMGQNTVGAALVGNVMLVVTNFSGLIAGPSLKKYTSRQVSIAGCILTGTGMIGASFATEMWHLIATYSIFSGLGIGLLQASTFLAVNAYFTTKRGRAQGVSMAGTGIGQMLMPHLVRYLLESYSFKGTTLILGALAFNGIAGAALFQPVALHMVPEKEENQPLLGKKKKSSTDLESNVDDLIMLDSDEEKSSKKGLALSVPSDLNNIDTVERKRRSYSSCSIGTKEDERLLLPMKKRVGFCTKIKNFFDLDLLLDCTFLNIIFGCALGFTANQNFNMLFPFFLQKEVGLTKLDTATCMSALAAADIIARLTIPIITDKFHISSRCAFFFGCVTVTMARTVLSYQTEYLQLILASALNGFFRSSIIIYQNLVVSEYCKKDDPKLPTALGINMMMKGFVVISFGEWLGWVRDYYSSYIMCFHAQNSLLMLTVVMWLPEFILKKCCLKRS